MKKNLLLFNIFFSLNFFAQNDSISKPQTEFFEKAEKLLQAPNGLDAMYYYHQVCFRDLKTTIGIKAKERIDSLLPIYQKEESKKWKGVWKLKQLKTTHFDYEKITIANDSIFFYHKENDSISTRIEKIQHTKYNPKAFTINIQSIKFSNNEIWEFSVDKVGDELRLFPNLKTDSKGATYIFLDERASIPNDSLREKTLAEEIRTYYIKM